jgi:hypothetical protein
VSGLGPAALVVNTASRRGADAFPAAREHFPGTAFEVALALTGGAVDDLADVGLAGSANIGLATARASPSQALSDLVGRAPSARSSRSCQVIRWAVVVPHGAPLTLVAGPKMKKRPVEPGPFQYPRGDLTRLKGRLRGFRRS